jgi:hypothetical protein
MKFKKGDYVGPSIRLMERIDMMTRNGNDDWRATWAANNWIAQVLEVRSFSVKLTIRGFPRRGDSWPSWDKNFVRKLNGIELLKLRHGL